jgi:peroxiredoxin
MVTEVVLGLALVFGISQVAAENPARASSLREEFNRIEADWNEAAKAFTEARTAARSPAEKKAVSPMMPDITAYAARFLMLAESKPDDPAARDALLWIVSKGGSKGDGDGKGSWPAQFGRAVDLLVKHHSNDEDVARTALLLQNSNSPHRDRFLRALYEKASSRAAKGTASLALAQYLHRKADLIVGLRERAARMPVFTEEYEKELRLADAEAMKTEACGLFQRIIEDYADFPYVRGGVLKARDLARKQTLGQVAEARLDEIDRLALGKPAPEIDAADLDGKRLVLSDFRGKVVVLVFWGSWCGPCLAQVPDERMLVEKLKNKPFALLGVACDPDKTAASTAARRHAMTWPSWYDGNPGEGPIASRYHPRGFPTIYVIDAKGNIRAKTFSASTLDKHVDQLLKELARDSEETRTR